MRSVGLVTKKPVGGRAFAVELSRYSVHVWTRRYHVSLWWQHYTPPHARTCRGQFYTMDRRLGRLVFYVDF